MLKTNNIEFFGRLPILSCEETGGFPQMFLVTRTRTIKKLFRFPQYKKPENSQSYECGQWQQRGFWYRGDRKKGR
jgi:hypothetical protein